MSRSSPFPLVSGVNCQNLMLLSGSWCDILVISLIGAFSISHPAGLLHAQIPCLLGVPEGQWGGWGGGQLSSWARDQEPSLGSFPTHCAACALSLEGPGKEMRRKWVPLLVQNVPVWLESLRSSLGEKNKTLLTGFSPGQVCFTSAFWIITALPTQGGPEQLLLTPHPQHTYTHTHILYEYART